jgi:hypothetical protein
VKTTWKPWDDNRLLHALLFFWWFRTTSLLTGQEIFQLLFFTKYDSSKKKYVLEKILAIYYALIEIDRFPARSSLPDHRSTPSSSA